MVRKPREIICELPAIILSRKYSGKWKSWSLGSAVPYSPDAGQMRMLCSRWRACGCGLRLSRLHDAPGERDAELRAHAACGVWGWGMGMRRDGQGDELHSVRVSISVCPCSHQSPRRRWLKTSPSKVWTVAHSGCRWHLQAGGFLCPSGRLLASS